MRTIQVVDYDMRWPGYFDLERDALAGALGEVAVAIHHIGSTAVPGLCAKPLIDILVEATDLGALDAMNDALAGLGYEAMGEFGIAGRRFFTKGGDLRTHHVHAFAVGDPGVRRHLAFRDYLRAHPEVAAEYGELKTRLAATCNNDNDVYCAGKEDWIKRVETAALVGYEA